MTIGVGYQDEAVGLHITVPLASFRTAQAGEWRESYGVPPHPTLYGMLLSYIGECDRLRYSGTQLAYALLSHPKPSRVVRTMWRSKSSSPPGTGNNRRPDVQELYGPFELAVWVRQGAMASRVAEALIHPESVERFGSLSLGESTHLVDEVRTLRNGDVQGGRLLVRDARGGLTLPVWVDHVGGKSSWGRYSFAEVGPNLVDISRAFVAVAPSC